ncbi:MAG: hypothetical protein JWN63_234 [Candidatus Acidoferrum typicum]|nr:hypothetical protein [Candidatus Acidoferrum typicum]
MTGAEPVRLFKYVTINTLTQILTSGIRFTQPGAFNDPFELLPEICVPIDQAERNLSISFDIAAKRRNPRVGEVGENVEGYNCCDITSRHILKELNRSVGIVCLSRDGGSLLMWSHYADQYTGAVIEFDGSNEFFRDQIDIEYRSHRPRKDISAYLSAGVPIPLAELCVKSDKWAYEDEVRIVRNLDGCEGTGHLSRGFPIYVQKVPQNSIREITLGERTSIENQRKVWEMIKDTNISLSLAAVANWGYEFRKERAKLGPGPIISPRTAHIFSHLPNGLGDVARLLIEKHPMSQFVNTTA